MAGLGCAVFKVGARFMQYFARFGENGEAPAAALADQVAEARRVVDNLLRLDASLTVSAYASKSSLRFSGKFDPFLDGLRMAGLPE